VAAKKGGKWIQGATAKMKAKGTLGAFGKATKKKIAAGKKAGGVEKKRAVFAANMKKISAKRKKASKPKPKAKVTKKKSASKKR
jgi:hypothetical protein